MRVGGRARLFSEELSTRARATAAGCTSRDADWGKGKNIFPTQVARRWKRFSRVVVHPPSVGGLDEATSNLV